MILCFSGTGNSRYVGGLLAGALGECNVVSIDSINAVVPDVGDERVIWVMPVHAWSVPAIVVNFITSLPFDTFNPKALHHLVLTCGDDIGQADRVWRALIKSHGWRAAGAYSIAMPNTYVCLPGFDVDTSDIEHEKIANAPIRVAVIADSIVRNGGEEVVDVVPGSMPGIKTRIIGSFFRKFLMSSRPFKYSEQCNGCGLCSRNCPLGNITLTGSRPVWGDECCLCLHCYHSCPRHAIDYGRATRSKGQYRPKF